MDDARPPVDRSGTPLVAMKDVSIAFGGDAILKVYRHLRPGIQPDIEVGRFLTEVAQYPNTPAYLGHATLASHESDNDGTRATIAAAFAFVPNQGDGWTAITDTLAREIEERTLMSTAGPIADTGTGAASEEMTPDELAQDAAPAVEEIEPDETALDWPYPLDLPGLLGQRTAELHAALATETDNPDFGTEAISKDDLDAWVEDTRKLAAEAFGAMAQHRGDADVASLLGRRGEMDALIERVSGAGPRGRKQRIHGDYHLGQVLIAQADFQIIDFEGEPRRNLAERRAKYSPLRDVAGMLRSFDYAAESTLDRLRSRGANGEDAERLAREWRDTASTRFRAEYEAVAGEVDEDLLAILTLQKALYEILYEAGMRPDWIGIPVRGVLSLLDETNAEGRA